MANDRRSEDEADEVVRGVDGVNRGRDDRTDREDGTDRATDRRTDFESMAMVR